jgi:hypothetical protein
MTGALPRHVPEGFEMFYIERGRLACEEHFKAARVLVNAWMRECGKQRMIKARAAYVARKRDESEWITRSSSLTHREVKRPTIRETINDRRKVSFMVARQAAHHLRISRNGGMVVSPAGDNEWWVGTRRLSAAQVLDLARERGFDDRVVMVTVDRVRAISEEIIQAAAPVIIEASKRRRGRVR